MSRQKTATTIMPMGFLNLEVTAKNTKRLLTDGCQEGCARLLILGRRRIKGLLTMTISLFLAALGSEAPPADRARDMNLYSWLIGSWEMETIRYLDDGTTQGSTGEIHFGWVLEGRAIQDIWIRPKRPAPSTMYGTTLRIFDPGIGGWHIIWSDPLNQDYSRQIGRAEGKDIVQIGDDSRGLKARWRFTEITADSFHWIGEERSSNSDPWQITYEHFARRTDPCFGAVL